jgi:hypothetical protein
MRCRYSEALLARMAALSVTLGPWDRLVQTLLVSLCRGSALTCLPRTRWTPVPPFKWVEYWLRWFGQRAAVAIEGILASAEYTGARIEKQYFDGPGADDWPALEQYRDSFVPALGSTHIFVPGQ